MNFRTTAFKFSAWATLHRIQNEFAKFKTLTERHPFIAAPCSNPSMTIAVTIPLYSFEFTFHQAFHQGNTHHAKSPAGISPYDPGG